MSTLIDTERWFRWGVPPLTLAIFSTLALAAYWLVIDRYPPITVDRGEIAGSERQPDGSLVVFVRWHGTRHRFCPGVSKRWLADGALLPLPDIPYPPEDADAETGRAQWEVAVQVPAYFLTTGHVDLAYRIRIDYSCNPLQEIAFPIRVAPPPVPFRVEQDGRVVPGKNPGLTPPAPSLPPVPSTVPPDVPAPRGSRP
jgi:hypothetical protein